jgi:hypothetical protein
MYLIQEKNMEANWTLVPALPSLPETAWNTWFKKLQDPIYEIPYKLTPTEKFLLSMLEAEWLIIFHFIIRKKWLNKHKIPIKPREVKLFEPKGTYWYWLLELCIQLHITKSGNAYYNAGHWFFLLVNERRGANIKAFDSVSQHCKIEEHQEPQKQENSNKAWIGEKNSVIAAEQRFIGALRKSENPFHPDCYPHHYRLMESALEMKDFSNEFRANFWRPFMNAYSGWIKSIRSNFDSCAAIGEKVVIQNGRGKHKIPVEIPKYLDYKRPSFFVNPDALPDKRFSG